MKHVLITGASGMIGHLILQNCLQRDDVKQVSVMVRKPLGVSHPKLREIIHDDFLNYAAVEQYLQGVDVCFFCIGVYTGQVPVDEFKKITVDYTKVFAEALKKNSPQSVFCFLSGDGADPSEKSRILFAREKGKAENILINLAFKATYIFRPGYIYPVTKRVEPNFLYRVFRVLYKPLLSWLAPGASVTSVQLAHVMTDVGMNGGTKTIYSNRDIRKHQVKPFSG